MGGADEWLFSFTRDSGGNELQTGTDSRRGDASIAAEEASNGVFFSLRLILILISFCFSGV